MRFLEFIHASPPTEKRNRAEQGEQQWRQQAIARVGQPQQHWVKTQSGKKHGPFKNYEQAKTFASKRTDLGPNPKIVTENRITLNEIRPLPTTRRNQLPDLLDNIQNAIIDDIDNNWDGDYDHWLETASRESFPDSLIELFEQLEQLVPDEDERDQYIESIYHEIAEIYV
jgi:hypothetical protein